MTITLPTLTSVASLSLSVCAVPVGMWTFIVEPGDDVDVLVGLLEWQHHSSLIKIPSGFKLSDTDIPAYSDTFSSVYSDNLVTVILLHCSQRCHTKQGHLYHVKSPTLIFLLAF